jgi:hypothetical protein
MVSSDGGIVFPFFDLMPQISERPLSKEKHGSPQALIFWRVSLISHVTLRDHP